MMKIKWLNGIIPLLLMTSTYQAHAIPPEERAALVALYESTDGDNWKGNAGWLLNEGTECLWKGVKCDSEQLNVTSIVLFENNLAGKIPPEIGQLTKLTRLYLKDNQLIGEIPSEIGQLAQLGELDLKGNQLIGTIPSEIGQLIKIRKLNLSDNQLSGKIPPEVTQLSRLAVRGIIIPGLSVPGNMPPQQHVPEAKLRLTENCLTTTDPEVISFLNSVNGVGSNWWKQRADCPVTEDHAVAVYHDKTGVLVIKDVETGGQHYTADFHHQGDYQFSLVSVTVLAEGTYAPPRVQDPVTRVSTRSRLSATYDAETQVVSIPSVLAFGKLYNVKLKQNDAGLFVATDISEN